MINFLKGIFLHKNNGDHKPILRYTGLTCKGYSCCKCGYSWYEKNTTGEKF